MNQHLSQGRSATSHVVARASLRAAAARGRVDALNTRFAERSAELRRRLAADRTGEPDSRSEGEAGLESIEVVVLSVVGLGIAIALGAGIKALVDSYMAQLGGP